MDNVNVGHSLSESPFLQFQISVPRFISNFSNPNNPKFNRNIKEIPNQGKFDNTSGNIAYSKPLDGLHLCIVNN